MCIFFDFKSQLEKGSMHKPILLVTATCSETTPNKPFIIPNKIMIFKRNLNQFLFAPHQRHRSFTPHAAFTAVKVFQIAANLHFLYLSYHYTGMNDPPSNTFALHRIQFYASVSLIPKFILGTFFIYLSLLQTSTKPPVQLNIANQ